jgi:hypothetical protein
MSDVTPSETIAKICLTSEEYQSNLETNTRLAKYRIREAILDVMKNEAREGTMTRDDATDLFNKIAIEAGLDTVTTIGGLYTVDVSLNGYSIGVFSDVEAEDASDAEASVANSIELDDIELNFGISFGDESLFGSVGTSWQLDLHTFIVEALEYDASEQE